MRAFTIAERRHPARATALSRTRLACRRPGQARRGLVGLHATDPATVYLAARSRLRGSAGRELDRALYDRTLLRMIGMRRTLFVFPLDLAAVVQAACTEPIAAAQRLRYAKLIVEGGIAKDGRRWLDRAEAATLKALQTRGEAFATEPRPTFRSCGRRCTTAKARPGRRYEHDFLGSCSCSLLRAESFAAARGERGRAASGAGCRRKRG